MDKEKINEKVKKQFEINERDYLHEWHTFGYVYELVDFIVKECKSEVKEEIETLKRQLKYYKKKVGYVKKLKKSGEKNLFIDEKLEKKASPKTEGKILFYCKNPACFTHYLATKKIKDNPPKVVVPKGLELIEKIEEIINSIQEQTEERCIESCLDKMEWNGYCVSKYKLKSLIQQLKSLSSEKEGRDVAKIENATTTSRIDEVGSGAFIPKPNNQLPSEKDKEKVESKPFIDIKLTANSFRNIEKESWEKEG